MKTSRGNPESNTIPAGVTVEQLRHAVMTSGYPLQCEVATILAERFRQLAQLNWVEEEWSYIDLDTRELRALDIHARCSLYNILEQQPHVRPHLDLLIECKQSSMPFVFFLTEPKIHIMDFPLFAGLRSDEPVIRTDDDTSVWHVPLLRCLGLDDHPFVSKPPFCCATFSKAQRKGKNLELSGAEPFNNVVLPLVKAMQHFLKTESPIKTAVYFDCHLVLGVAVVDAPMLGFQPALSPDDFMLLPWVRIIRREAREGESPTWRPRQFAIDVIHKEFLEDYVENVVLPFAEAFSSKVLKHEKVLAAGKGFIPSIIRNGLNDIEQRLRP